MDFDPESYCYWFHSSHSQVIISVTDQRYINWTLRVASVHGLTSQLPFIESIEVISRNLPYLPKQPPK